jgi:hypothetical protein
MDGDEAHGEIQPVYAAQPNEPPQIITREESKKPARPADLESAMNRARERLARSESKPAPRPRRERRAEPPPPPEEPEPRPDAVAVGVPFPILEVQSVLWHPDPQRRQATLLVDGQLSTDAREGDLIGGVLVDRITPGSVEFRMGEERKRVDIAP